jgi:cation diffusion facilitator CzcD-associated flavoprotein CzcO
MVARMETAPAAKPAKLDASLDYDVIIVGGGQSGLYSLHRMRELGLKTRLFEAGSGEGGTWFW